MRKIRNRSRRFQVLEQQDRFNERSTTTTHRSCLSSLVLCKRPDDYQFGELIDDQYLLHSGLEEASGGENNHDESRYHHDIPDARSRAASSNVKNIINNEWVESRSCGGCLMRGGGCKNEYRRELMVGASTSFDPTGITAAKSGDLPVLTLPAESCSSNNDSLSSSSWRKKPMQFHESLNIGNNNADDRSMSDILEVVGHYEEARGTRTKSWDEQQQSLRAIVQSESETDDPDAFLESHQSRKWDQSIQLPRDTRPKFKMETSRSATRQDGAILIGRESWSSHTRDNDEKESTYQREYRDGFSKGLLDEEVEPKGSFSDILPVFHSQDSFLEARESSTSMEISGRCTTIKEEVQSTEETLASSSELQFLEVRADEWRFDSQQSTHQYIPGSPSPTGASVGGMDFMEMEPVGTNFLKKDGNYSSESWDWQPNDEGVVEITQDSHRAFHVGRKVLNPPLAEHQGGDTPSQLNAIHYSLTAEMQRGLMEWPSCESPEQVSSPSTHQGPKHPVYGSQQRVTNTTSNHGENRRMTQSQDNRRTSTSNEAPAAADKPKYGAETFQFFDREDANVLEKPMPVRAPWNSVTRPIAKEILQGPQGPAVLVPHLRKAPSEASDIASEASTRETPKVENTEISEPYQSVKDLRAKFEQQFASRRATIKSKPKTEHAKVHDRVDKGIQKVRPLPEPVNEASDSERTRQEEFYEYVRNIPTRSLEGSPTPMADEFQRELGTVDNSAPRGSTSSHASSRISMYWDQQRAMSDHSRTSGDSNQSE